MDADFAQASRLYDEHRFEKSFRIFMALARKGDLDAMNRIAFMYGEGQGTPKNVEASIEWDQRAAKRGSVIAMMNLGVTFLNAGDGETSVSWFRSALDHGFGEAAVELAKLYAARGQLEESTRYLNKALSSKWLSEASREEAMAIKGSI